MTKSHNITLIAREDGCPEPLLYHTSVLSRDPLSYHERLIFERAQEVGSCTPEHLTVLFVFDGHVHPEDYRPW